MWKHGVHKAPFLGAICSLWNCDSHIVVCLIWNHLTLTKYILHYLFLIAVSYICILHFLNHTLSNWRLLQVSRQIISISCTLILLLLSSIHSSMNIFNRSWCIFILWLGVTKCFRNLLSILRYIGASTILDSCSLSQMRIISSWWQRWWIKILREQSWFIILRISASFSIFLLIDIFEILSGLVILKIKITTFHL